MKLLHTSDWHLGRLLYNQKRDDEFASFLNWLLQVIQSEQIEVLLVAGDVFDTTTPSVRAQELYYGFLAKACSTTHCQIVVVAGNHDSPNFLEAPRGLLHALNVHVVGQCAAQIQDEVLLLRNIESGALKFGEPLVIVCAVPFLRDKEVRVLQENSSLEEREQDLVAGIAKHYKQVCEAAKAMQAELKESTGCYVPIVATGHLFTQGGTTSEGDGVRQMYVGNLAHVSGSIFSSCLDYVALGHLHVPQTVGQNEYVRYCGSPIPMGFGEAAQKKYVNIVTLSNEEKKVTQLEVPVFRKLQQVKGDKLEILQILEQLRMLGEPVWVEIQYTGQPTLENLNEIFLAAAKGSEVLILRIIAHRGITRGLQSGFKGEELKDLTPEDVFQRCLATNECPPNETPETAEMWDAFREICHGLQIDTASEFQKEHPAK